jgi:hypothetical protein
MHQLSDATAPHPRCIRRGGCLPLLGGWRDTTGGITIRVSLPYFSEYLPKNRNMRKEAKTLSF